MPLIQSFQDLNFVNSEFGLIVKYVSFLEYLRKNHAKGVDKWSEIKKYNLDSKVRGDFVSYNDVLHLPVAAILKFAFNHQHMLRICKIISDDVQNCLFDKPALDLSKKNNTTKDLYDQVCKSDMIMCKDSAYVNVQNVPVADIPNLVLEYKDSFDSTEWSRIVFFEFHFNKACPDSFVNPPSIQLKLKYEFWDTCQMVHKVAPEISKQQKNLVRERHLRKSTDDEDGSNKRINGAKQKPRHLSSVVDEEVTEILRERSENVEDVALTLNCDDSCKHQHGLHLLVCLHQECSEKSLQQMSSIIASSVEDNHKDIVMDIVFVKEECLQNYSNDIGDLNRPLLFHDLTQGSLSADIVYVYQNHGSDLPAVEPQGKCKTCYASCPTAFELMTVDIEREWFLDVPLLMQMIFETFINPKSMSRTPRYNEFLNKKLPRLYETYDSLLKLYNRKYSGGLKALKRKNIKKPSLPSGTDPLQTDLEHHGSRYKGNLNDLDEMSTDESDLFFEEDLISRQKARKRKKCA